MFCKRSEVRLDEIHPKFVEFVPRELKEGVLYISETHKVAVHKCASGCGEKVVTPLSPVDWQVKKDGDFVSLYPSIGNWNFACRSHYWIRRNRIVWADSFTDKQIARVQERDRRDRAKYIEERNRLKSGDGQFPPPSGIAPTDTRWWTRLLDWIRGQRRGSR